MTTFQMVISIIGVVVSVLTLFGLGVVMKHFWDDKHEAKKASRTEEKERAKKERQEEIREVIQEELKPLKEEVASVKEGVDNLQKGVARLQSSVVTIDRIIMKITLDGYKQQGYASASDRAAWKETYDDYKDLGGNHFKEYVDEWKNILDNLPKKEDIILENNVEKPVKPLKKTTTKTIDKK